VRANGGEVVRETLQVHLHKRGAHDLGVGRDELVQRSGHGEAEK